jgi:hypothetical protein
MFVLELKANMEKHTHHFDTDVHTKFLHLIKATKGQLNSLTFHVIYLVCKLRPKLIYVQKRPLALENPEKECGHGHGVRRPPHGELHRQGQSDRSCWR